MLKQGHSVAELPELPCEIEPPGLDSARQWYLYENIRPFCGSVLASDMTCPLPKPGYTADISQQMASNTSHKRAHPHLTTPTAGPSKRQRTCTCSHCKETGHFRSKGHVLSLLDDYLLHYKENYVLLATLIKYSVMALGHWALL